MQKVIREGVTVENAVRRLHAVRATAAAAALGVAIALAPAIVGRSASAAPAPRRAAADTNAAPAVGSEAPDFTAPIVWSNGRTAQQSLRALRGRVVVVAFYPGDRTSGCTVELSKFRDDFAAMFGDGVTVLPVSLDNIASHRSWSAEMKFPFGIVSDTTGAIARRYASLQAGASYASRTVFVVGKDGRILWRDLRFRALDETAYQRLAAAVEAAKRG